MESIMHKYIVDYFGKNKILNLKQYGLRSKHLTVLNLLKLIKELTSLVDSVFRRMALQSILLKLLTPYQIANYYGN